MIAQAGQRRICQSCRHDLQSVLERRFRSTVVLNTTRPVYVRQSYHFGTAKRQLYTTTRSIASHGSQSGETSNQILQNEPSEHDAIPETQEDVIEQLEKELGKPIEQAIREDQISAVPAARQYETNDSTKSLVGDSSPVAKVRSEGGSTADLVRTARQTYGDVLPEGELNEEELKLYRRLYGEPLEHTQDEDQFETLKLEQNEPQNRLFTADGEEIEFRPYHESLVLDNGKVAALSPSISETDITLSRTRDIASSISGDIMEEDEYDDVEDDEDASDSHRGHPLTAMGKFRTNPKTTFLSQDGFVQPVENIMSNYSNKHLKEMCERTFGGPGLPDSPLTPRSGRSRKQVPIPLDAGQNTMGQMEANAFITAVMPPTYASITSVLVETRKRLGPTWLTDLLAREGGPRVLDAGAGGAGIVAWREIVQAHWQTLHPSDQAAPPPPTTKAVVLTGSDGLRHRAADMLENTTFVPRLPDYIHSRDAPTLQDERPTQQRKKFDVIIASHALLGMKEDWMRKQYVQNLWTMLSNEGGVLILVEKGVPRGFEAIAGAREVLLDRYIAIPEGQTTCYSQSHDQQLENEDIHKKGAGMIVAPCTNHERCPMYTAPGLSRGRKDICSFQQRYIRPPFLQRILGAKDRNHDDVDFSYLSVMKGDDIRSRSITTWDHLADPLSAPHHSDVANLNEARKVFIEEFTEGFEHLTPPAEETGAYEQLPTFSQMPRIVYPPLKRRGHVSIDLCTPTGKLERWTIPRSFSKQAYRDARKSRWGDLWALGAKTHIARNLQLGTPDKTLFGKDGELIQGRGRGRKERLKIKALELLEKQEEQKMDDLMEQRDMMAALDEELEIDAGVPNDMADITEYKPSTLPAAKPRNNRERKAVRRAVRDGRDLSLASPRRTATVSDDADLSFRPRTQPSHAQRNTEDQSIEHAMSEWQAEFEREAALDKGKKFNKFGSRSNASKEFQRERNRSSASYDDL